MMRAVLATLVACWTLSLPGCGQADGRRPVSGEVTLHGQPLAAGTIVFESADGNRGGTTIENGKYSLPAKLGLLPGKYTVRVSAVESSAAASASAPPGPEAAAIERANKDVIPDDFNSKSTLTYEAGPGQPTEFNIAIP